MSVLLSPIGNGINFLTTTGQPLAGGKLNTYQAGSSTPLATYTDVNGLIPNLNPVILGTDGRLPSELWLTQGYSYKFILTDSANNLIATYDNLYGILATSTAATSPFSSGMILIWSGSIGQISSIAGGWVLCDGSNGTPDLRDRFVIGAGNAYSVAQTGGSADAVVVTHQHTVSGSATGTTNSTSLTGSLNATAQSNTTGTVSASGIVTATNIVNSYVSGSGGGTANSRADYAINATHTHTFTGSFNTTSAYAGVSGANANLPPYYALCYIMKT